MSLESTMRTWAHQHGLQRSRAVVSAYRGISRLRFRNAWDSEVEFRGRRFEIGRDLTLFPAVRSGGFEAEELDVLLPMVPRGARVWDVGANIGIYTVLLADAAADGHVDAFEPVPETHERLVGNVARNHLTNVTLHRVALSSRPGTARMAVHADAHGCDQIGEVQPGTAAIEVGTMTGDDFLAASSHGDPDVVKVDIEGHEPEFLAGAWEMLQRRRPMLIMEVNPTAWHSDAQVRTWQETLDRLFALYGDGTWFAAGHPSTVDHVDATALDQERAYTLLFAGASRA
jgi:FkbM family methyltransferase